MARKVRDTELETRTARAKLERRGKPHYRAIYQGCHIGYRKSKDGGVWVGRRRAEDGGYELKRLGVADDHADADGVGVLDFAQAQERVREWCSERARADAGVNAGPFTVAQAVDDYFDNYEPRGKSVRDTRAQVDAHILPAFGEIEVADLTAKKIREWHNAMAEKPRRLRSAARRPVRYAEATDDDESKRRRKSTANRVLSIFKAILNFAHKEGSAASDDAWRRVLPFKGVDAPRIRYLSVDECVRLVNGCAPHFRPLVQAALFTGCRYGELTRMEVADFNPDSGTVLVHISKTKKRRHVVLTDEGQRYFADVTAGRGGVDLIFKRPAGLGPERWGKTHQIRPFAEACKNAKITGASFHTLRHTYASQLVMAGVPLNVVAQNLGHADTRMCEKHYAHLAPSYVADVIRSTAPTLGIAKPSNVKTLKPRRPGQVRRGRTALQALAGDRREGLWAGASQRGHGIGELRCLSTKDRTGRGSGTN